MRAASSMIAQRVGRASASQARGLATLKVDNPYTGGVACEVPLLGKQSALALVDRSAVVQKAWANGVTLDDRIAVCKQFMIDFEANKHTIATGISEQMGKPYSQAVGEVGTVIERTEAFLQMAHGELADVDLPDKPGFQRKIAKEPVGVVLTVAPWNYPLACAINSVIPAVLAGNTVVLKHSSRTPLCSQYIADAFDSASKSVLGLSGVVTSLDCGHAEVADVIAHEKVGFVAFTGSVSGGRSIYEATASSRFVANTLELGGKDPAYVAEDADLMHAVTSCVEGSFYNAGQSCCAIERVYVHRSLYGEFVDRAAELVSSNYTPGNPLDDGTSLGPVAQQSSIPFLEGQVSEAVGMGAKMVAGTGKGITDAAGNGRFFSPTLLSDCDHTMGVMTEESFGPVLGIMPVDSDEEALTLMNDSPYGLTAALFTSSHDRAVRLTPQIETGTVFMNRCDYLDPYLAWTGVKDTGCGVSLSQFGFSSYYRLKSWHHKLVL